MLTGHAMSEVAMKAVNEGEITVSSPGRGMTNGLRFAMRSAIEKFDLEAENRRLLATVKTHARELGALAK